ncbi:MAG: HAD family phosphatase [Planctomycetaceae bacterium]|jgi:HAD superfamily hydrolase (TIGR01549 family)|nr:HAD family phosphatase [Planctomycetaceae bacterium]
MKIKAVAFDMDGLMFDTENIYRRSAEILFARRGKVFTEELFYAVMGHTPQESYELFKETFDFPETWQELRTEAEAIFLELLDNGFASMPGLYELLEYLEARNIPKGVCTSSDYEVALEVLRRKDVLHRFNFVLTADDVTHGKPAPDIYLEAAERFGIAPSEMLVLEDSTAGCQAAHRAGAFGIAVRAKHNAHSSFDDAMKTASSLDDPQILELF